MWWRSMCKTTGHMRVPAPQSLALHALLLLTAAACGSNTASTDPDCEDAFKCDIPLGPSENRCVERRLDAFNENQYAFLDDTLRWSCADVAGVTGPDRGQEYCEYFAMVKLPTSKAGDGPTLLGKNLGSDYMAGTTEERLELDFEDLIALEADETATVGQCVFTSWNSDIDGPIGACIDEEAGTCPTVLGLQVTQDAFRMTFEANSADAAQLLVEDCMEIAPKEGDFEAPFDPLHDDFFRGCMLNSDIHFTPYRKSDTTVCASALRLAECGCAPVDPDLILSEYISPFNRLGFPLGTWSDPFSLPAGCEYINDGEGSDTLVTCDLSAAEVIRGANDLKGYCMDKYADNVVVHVGLPPAEGIACDPSTSDSPYASTCGTTPWVVEPTDPQPLEEEPEESDY